MVVIYHFGYNLSEIFDMNINFFNPFFNALQKIGVSLFILLSGIASNYSENNLKRGIKLFIIALLLTLVTYLFNNDYYIKFGILHFLGIAIILYHFYRHASYQELFAILIFAIFITGYVQTTTVHSPYLFWLGLYNRSFVSADYVPLFGFLTVFIIGNILGKYLKAKKWYFNKLKANIFTFLGRHTLLIYLIHQPIIIAILYLILRIL